MSKRGRPNAFMVQLMGNALTSIADEMAVSIVRTSYSDLTREQWDFSTGIGDMNDRVMAQGFCAPIHMGSFPDALENVLDVFKGDILPGDVFISNDPYQGGMHLPDIYVFKPIFVGGEPQVVAIALNHFSDMGGRVAGSMAHDSREIFAEGLRIPPIKLYEAGKLNEAVFKILEENARIRRIILGDLRALVGACHGAEGRFVDVMDHYGIETTKLLMEELLNYSEELTRAEIRSWPDGTYSFTDHVDDDGVDKDPIKIQVTLMVEGDMVKVDFSGTDAQRKRSSCNATLPSTKSRVYCALRGVMPSDIPINSGFYRPIKVSAPLGSCLNAEPPAAVALRQIPTLCAADAVYGALAKVVPNRVFACGSGVASLTLHGWDQENLPVLVHDNLNGAWGGRPSKDGVDAITTPSGNAANLPVEVIESRHPVLVEQYGFVPNSGGPGKYRGGLSHIREWRWLGDEASLQISSARRKFPPWGLYGGREGNPSAFSVIHESGREEILPTKAFTQIENGARARLVMPGGGGWGDSLERDPKLVLSDVVNGKMSVEHAEEEYGVVIDGAAMMVDVETTPQLREQRRKAERLEAETGLS